MLMIANNRVFDLSQIPSRTLTLQDIQRAKIYVPATPLSEPAETHVVRVTASTFATGRLYEELGLDELS